MGFGWVETLRRRADVAFDEEDYEAAEGVEDRRNEGLHEKFNRRILKKGVGNISDRL